MIKLTKLITEMKEQQEIENSPIPNTKNLTGCRIKYTGSKTDGKPKYVVYGQDGRALGKGHTILVQTANDSDGTHAILLSDFEGGRASVELVLDKDFEMEIMSVIEKDEDGYWEYIKFSEAEYYEESSRYKGPAKPNPY